MKQEINPKDTNRAIAFELWTKSPMPMVTFTKTFDVTRLRKVSRQRGMKFNMLLCWCIGRAASKIDEFYMLPKDGKLYRYDRMAINVIADNVKGGLSFCDVAVCDDLEAFNANYLHLTETISQTCQDILDDEAVIDRCHNPIRDTFRIKKMALLLVGAATLAELFDSILAQYQLCLSFFKLEDAGRVLVRGVKDKGDIKNTNALNEAFELGQSI